jgi:hypothetical protein
VAKIHHRKTVQAGVLNIYPKIPLNNGKNKLRVRNISKAEILSLFGLMKAFKKK